MDELNQNSIDAAASDLDGRLIALRRDLHANPEGPGQEERTASVVAEMLAETGLAVTTGVGGHGVVGVLEGGRPGRTVAYRADMDAVPPAEQIMGGEGPAHLCGHDVHTTVGVGVAKVLARLRKELSGTVVFLFQPAEEALTGAQSMLDDGALASTAPEEIHAMHCGPLPVGQFGVNVGTGLPGQDHCVISLSGDGADERAELLAAEIAALTTVAIPETPADLDQLVEDLRTPNGPLSEYLNVRTWTSVVEGQVVVDAFYRCWPEERYVEVREEITRIVRSCGDAELTFPNEPFPAMVCPEEEGRAVERHLRRVWGGDSVTAIQAAVPFSGEDFALFLNRIPGTYTYLGVRAPEAGIRSCYPHFGTFDPDERAIGFGVRAMAGWLAERSR